MSRTQTTLAGLLLVQVVLILLVRSPFSSATAAVESRDLLPKLEAFTATRLELLGDEDRQLTLIREGEGWALEELGGFPADGRKVDDLLDDLRGLEVRRPVVSSGRYHAAFKVGADDNEGRVRIWDDPSADPEIDLILGSSPNYRAIHVRLAGDDPVFEVRDLAAYDVRADSAAWIEKDLVNVPEAELIGLTLSNENGSIELLKEGGSWLAADVTEELDPSEVDSLVRAATSIQIADAVGRKDAEAQGLAGAAATLTLRWRSPGPSDETEGAPAPAAQEATVTIGGKLADNESQRYISRSNFDFTGSVWESSVQTLLERKLEDLIAGPEDDAGEAG